VGETFDFFSCLYYTRFSWGNRGSYLSITYDRRGLLDYSGTISEIKRLNTGKKVIDLGCGAGQLVIDLLKNGYDACGVDNAPNMIAEARERLLKEFPTKMIRRQHTPEELESVLKKASLKLKYVVYYHCHPYLPRYEKLFPIIFNKIALIMQPLGYTPLGATICSAFVAVIEK